MDSGIYCRQIFESSAIVLADMVATKCYRREPLQNEQKDRDDGMNLLKAGGEIFMEKKIVRISRMCLLFIMFMGLYLFASMTAKAVNPTEAELQPDKLYKNYDLTGNGKKDRIKIKTSKGEYFKTVSIIINGKKRAVYKDINDITAKIYTLKNGKPFLYLWLVVEDWEGPVCGIFQYKSGKLKQVVNCQKFFSQKKGYEYGYAVHSSDIKVKGNGLTVDFWLMCKTVGGMSCRYRFAYKNGTLKRTSSQTSSVKVNAVESTGILTAAKNIKVYTTPTGKKVRYTLKAGKRIKVIGAYVKSGKFSLKVKNLSTGKIGWLKCLKDFPSDHRPPFREVIYSG